MALDGIFLHYLTNELRKNLIGSVIHKIYQPSPRMLTMTLRDGRQDIKLLISATQNSSRVHITSKSFENPVNPTSFCMLLRKRLMYARIIDVVQYDLDRVIILGLESKNDLGDISQIHLICEIMGKYSNIILTSDKDMIIDSLIRVNSGMSSKRLILPGYKYEFPPEQEKKCILNGDIYVLSESILNSGMELKVKDAISKTYQGVSLKTANNLILDMGIGNKKISDLSNEENKLLLERIKNFIKNVRDLNGEPLMVIDDTGGQIDISINKFKGFEFKKYDNFSELLDNYYYLKDKCDIIKGKMNTIRADVTTRITRYRKKVEIQKRELELCKNKDTYKIYGDLLLSNLNILKKGMKSVTVKNFYAEDEDVTINLDVKLSGVENMQKYYKKYDKCKKATKAISEQLRKASEEIEYLESILEYLSICENSNDIEEVKKELHINGYMKSDKNIKRVVKSEPMRFKTPDGLKVLVGKNGLQNERLTFKIAKKTDIWFHTKDIPGSHTILFLSGKKASYESILYAANICCLYSKAKKSSNVAVDYTDVKNVRKIPGGKVGLVNYKNYKTIYVTPDDTKLNNREW